MSADKEIVELICQENFSVVENISNHTKKFIEQICTYMISNDNVEFKGDIDKAILLLNIILNKEKYINLIPMPIETIDCNNLNLLTWIANSCYIDSVLISLLLIPNKFITNNILSDLYINSDSKKYSICRDKITYGTLSYKNDLQKRGIIQDELRNITSHLRNGGTERKNCINLRRLLQNCNNPVSTWWTGNMEDAGEFLKYIVLMFIPDVLIFEQITTGINTTNNFTRVTIKRIQKGHIVHTIASTNIIDNTNISYYIDYTEDVVGEYINDRYKYNKKTERIRIIYAPYIIFHVERLQERRFINKVIIPDKYINISKNNFELSSVVVFLHNHYTSYFKCNNTWYYYNDIQKKDLYKKVGTYEKLLLLPNTYIKTNATLFFYTKIEELWTIYSTKNCNYCKLTKDWLKTNNKHFNEVNMTDISEQEKEKIYTELDPITEKYRKFPMIFKNKMFIGGYTKLKSISK